MIASRLVASGKSGIRVAIALRMAQTLQKRVATGKSFADIVCYVRAGLRGKTLASYASRLRQKQLTR